MESKSREQFDSVDEKDYEFYAIVDEDDGVVSVRHEKYGEIKAIFRSYVEASNALELQDSKGRLRVEPCEIVSA
ncbi:Uncharacterised protein [Cedecea lapagei]|uniref:Uncharacterized protein n=1 Tax=Cedecea lapagei TaxID=158823 RepID=A0A3S4KVY9_9ENTR|nr:hypothetical protein [Cedecea lapagei]VEC00008.1 Uncharacterised protein [Cedecea lapagei]